MHPLCRIGGMASGPWSTAPTLRADGRADQAYLRLLEGIGQAADMIGPDRSIAAHWPFVGSRFAGLMIAGQALERWDNAESTAIWSVADATTEEGRQRVLNGTRAWATREPEPISEVMRYANRRGSPFWKFSERAVEQLEPDAGGPWFSRFAWWNLYPIGWQDRHGTPTGDLHSAQTPFVTELFWAVAEELGVKRLLLVSGKDWWGNARELLGLQGLTEGVKPVIAFGKVRGIAVVATYHPGAHIKGGTRIGFAAAAVEALSSLDR